MWTTAQLVWMCLLTGLSSGFLPKVVDWFRGKDLWREIYSLRGRIEVLESKLEASNFVLHYWRGVAHSLHLSKLVYWHRINGLLEDLGKAPEFDVDNYPDLPEPPPFNEEIE